MQIDTSTEFGTRAAKRLHEEPLGWLTTVRANGTPVPIPVWFLWDGETALIYSRPDQAKLRNLARNPNVSLHLDGDGRGGNIVVLTGSARVVDDVPPADQIPAYVEKYAALIKRVTGDPASFAAAYSVPIRFTPDKLLGH